MVVRAGGSTLLSTFVIIPLSDGLFPGCGEGVCPDQNYLAEVSAFASVQSLGGAPATVQNIRVNGGTA
jgi:hypothetical protein